MNKRANYKIKCLKDDKIFDSVEAACSYYGKTPDQVYWRLDDGKDHQDGFNWVRVIDNTEALESVKQVKSAPFIEKFGEKTVPLPGYEEKYTISTSGVITDITHFNKVVPVRTKVTVTNKVILNQKGRTQTHCVENLMKKAFGDPENY